MGQHVEEVALLGVDDLLHLGQLVAAEALLGQPCKQLLARVGRAPDGAQLGFVLEELRQLAEEHFHELLRGHRRAVGMPEGRAHHVLDGALLAVGELHLDLLRAQAASAGSALGRLWRTSARLRVLARTGDSASGSGSIGSPSHSGSLKWWCAFTKS